jgi:maltose-binding protein MalE
VIISTQFKEGKRGMRVYPPWDLPSSKQAQKHNKAVALLFRNPINQPLDLEKKSLPFKKHINLLIKTMEVATILKEKRDYT